MVLHDSLCAAQVRLADGRMQQCLVPVACLMNHSPWPHIVRYGHVDSESGRLKFPLLRSRLAACASVRCIGTKIEQPLAGGKLLPAAKTCNWCAA